MSVTVDDMIDRLEMYVLKRQIGIAKPLADEFLNESSTSPFKESGYAILSIMVSYFEMIEQFITGQSSRRQESSFFVSGFRKVYPHASFMNDNQIRQIYAWVRCGMYHEGMTKEKTMLSRYYLEGVALHGQEIHINPGKMVEEIRSHFCNYIYGLRNLTSPQRANFEQWCHQIGFDVPDTPYVQGDPTKAPWHKGSA